MSKDDLDDKYQEFIMIVQGIGDEVVGVLIVLFLVLLVSILWLSTHVQERPPVRAVVIRSANSETIAEFSAEPSPQVFIS